MPSIRVRDEDEPMCCEFELKYAATAEQLEAVVAEQLEYCQVCHMETTYFDTPSYALSDRRITLRRRMENGVSVCTVKTPLPTMGRGEWDCRMDRIEDAIPELCKRGASQNLLELTRNGVVPLCGACFDRRVGRIQFANSCLELTLDRGVLYGGGRELPLCEIEVELKNGVPEDAVAYARALARGFGLRPQSFGKYIRALVLARDGCAF